MKSKIILLAGMSFLTLTLSAQTKIITTIGGTGVGGYNGDGIAATAAELNAPDGMAIDASGNIYMAEAANHRIRKVTTAGIISTVAGNGTAGYANDGVAATSTEINTPTDVAIDASGNIYIADEQNNRIREVNTSGVISTIAGNGTAGYTGDGMAATASELNQPGGVFVDASGNLFIADYGNSRVREVTTAGIISTVAGNGTAGYLGDGVAATATEINNAIGVLVDSIGDVYIADSYSNRVRKVNTAGIISTIAGTGTAGHTGDGGPATAAELNWPVRLFMDKSGNLIVSDAWNGAVRMITPGGTISTLAGDGTQGYSGDGGPATSAEMHQVTGAVLDASGNLYIDDELNNRLRKVAPSACQPDISTVGGTGTGGYNGDGIQATAAELNQPDGMAIDQYGNIYIAEPANSRIRKVASSGIISTVAGNGTASFVGDGGNATSAEINTPIDVAVDGSGNIYIADRSNNRVREVNTAGIITTVAGNGTAGYTSDGGLATSTNLNEPGGVSVDASGNIYIADYMNSRIRKVNTAGIITTVAGNGTAGYTGDGVAATATEINNSIGVLVDSIGEIFIADNYNNRVRKVNTAGIISTIAGTGVAGHTGDGGAATTAELNWPTRLFMDKSGNLLVSDAKNGCIRMITPAGIISTVAGTGVMGYNGDGVAATSAELNQPCGAVLDAHGNLYIDDELNNRLRKVTPCALVVSCTLHASFTNTLGAGGQVTFTSTSTGATSGTQYSWNAGDGVGTGTGSTFSYTYAYNGTYLVNFSVSDSTGACTSSATAYVTITGGACQPDITTVGGTGVGGYNGDNIAASAAELNAPDGMAIDNSGNIYIAEYSNSRIRKITTAGVISTVAGNGSAGYVSDGVAATATEINIPTDVAVDASGNIYIADEHNNRVREVNSAGIISTVAGNGTGGYTSDGIAATASELNQPGGVAVDAAGNLFIADYGNSRIREVNTAGIISTVAGNGAAGYVSDGVAATSTQIYNAIGVIVDSIGDIYIADSYNNRVRKVNSAGIISTIAGNGAAGYTGDGGAATAAELNWPVRLFMDKSGNLLIADAWNGSIRQVTPTGIISTVAGNGTQGFSGDGGPAISAELHQIAGVVKDAAGDIYIDDELNNRLRKVTQCALPPPCNLQASFTNVMGTGGQVTFTSTSTGTTPGTKYSWDAGDNKGHGTSNTFNYTYAFNGTYAVNLNISDSVGRCATIATVFITVTNASTCGLHSNFSAVTGSNGLVTLTSTSTGTSASTQYYWNMGDNTGIGNGSSFAYTYGYNGTYPVDLFITDSSSSCSSDTMIYVTISNANACSLHADFTYTTGANGQVTFTNASIGMTGTTQIYWYTGDSVGYGYGNPYSYIYQKNGTYPVNLYLSNTTAGCTSDTTIMVTVSNANNTANTCTLGLIVQSAKASCDTCNDGGATVTATSGTGPYSYNWSNGSTSTSIVARPGIYTCCVTDANGCSSCASTTVSDSCLYAEFTYTVKYNTAGDSATISFVSISDTVCGDSLTHGPSKTLKSVSYTWNFGDGNTQTISGIGVRTSTHSFATNSSHNITLAINREGSQVKSVAIKPIKLAPPTGPTGIASLSNSSDIKLFPNPNNGSFMLTIVGIVGAQETELQITNLLGEIVYTTSAHASNGVIRKEINLPNVASGTYFVRVVTASKVYVSKVLISR